MRLLILDQYVSLWGQATFWGWRLSPLALPGVATACNV